MLDDFLIRAALAGLAVALAAGPLGCFVVWRRMAYFGEATSHAAILGVALALAFSANIFVGTLAVALLMALAVSALTGRGLAMDTTLGVLAHAALAFGLVGVSFLSGVRVDLNAYLFGDILAVSRTDLIYIWGGVAVVLVLALALVVAVAIKVVGALLIVAMLIIPAAAARAVSRSPEAMAILAVAIGAASSLGGLALSLTADTPAGPSIVAVAAVLFAIVTAISLALRHKITV
ncbi:metal ABC transporter permease [Actibacterium sp.]|uniref:metal ABC transporter permease n=1 Tax=Actibacterium sp. TaxID=1872125 RepID=UPI003569E60C